MLKKAALQEMKQETDWKADIEYLLIYICSILRGVYKVQGSLNLPSRDKASKFEQQPKNLEEFFKIIDKQLNK